MKLNKDESDLAWAALKRGLIRLEDIEKAAAIQLKEQLDGKRHPRSLTVILIALNRLRDVDAADLLSHRTA